MRGVMAGNFWEVGGGKGTRSTGRGKDEVGRMRKKNGRHSVPGLITKSGIEEPDFAAGEIFFEEGGEFASGAGIVSAIEVDAGIGLQFFETTGPDGVCNTSCDGLAGDSKTAVLEESRCDKSVEGILQLEAAGQAAGDFERSAGRVFGDAGADKAVFHRLVNDAAGLHRFDDGAIEFASAIKEDTAGLGILFGKDDRYAGLQDATFFACAFP